MAVALILAADVQQNAVVLAARQLHSTYAPIRGLHGEAPLRVCVRVCVEFASSRSQLVEQAYLDEEAHV